MTSPTRSLVAIVLVSWWVNQFTGVPAVAAERTWIGGNVDWIDNSGNANWAPVADEPDTEDEAIFNTPNTLSLGSNNSIQALTMSGGVSLSTANNDLTVNGAIRVEGSSELTIGGAASVVTADSVAINNGEIIMSGGTLNVVDETGNGLLHIFGDFSGHGTVNMQDLLPGVESLIINRGVISASSPPNIVIGSPPPVGTLTINISDATDGRIDLDGPFNFGRVNVFRNQTLDINGTLDDAFGGAIHLFHNATLDISTAWELSGFGGTITVDNGFAPGIPPITPDVPADTSFISGGTLTQTGGAIAVVDNDGTLQFNAPFTMNGGSLINNGRVVFSADATIGASANVTMPTTSSSITVNAGVTVNFDQANFNPDGDGAATNVITVNSGGVLDLDLGAGADKGFGGAIVLNGGELDVTTADDNWSIDRTVNVGADSGTSQINGEEVTIAGATITVGANATLEINADAVWEANGNLVTNAGATTRLDGTTTFNGNGNFTGNGTLLTRGDTTFEAATTINMPAGTVDLDGGDVIANFVAVVDPVTINAGTMANFGDAVLGSDELLINNDAGGSLTVNLTDPNAEWTLSGELVIGGDDINGPPGTSINGSDFNMAGTTVILVGESAWTARADISGVVTLPGFSELHLHGGDLTDAGVNRLEGGTIEGGNLRALTDEGLFGFGTISASIYFENNTELRADNGILNVNGHFFDLGVFGTADTDGIVNRPDAWNTAFHVDFVNMRGGEIRGGTITNDNANGITGFGLISAQVINNTRLVGEGGGTLVVETAGNDNDWDGTTNTGQIWASLGDVELRDNANFPFTGTVRADAGRTVFANGFELQFQPGSRLELTQGTYRTFADSDLDFGEFGGTVIVHPGGPSTLRMFGRAWFRSSSTTTLHADLVLDTARTFIDEGAEFGGSGALINVPRSILTIQDAVDLGVSIVNDGIVRFGSSFFTALTAQVSAVHFEQTEQGILQIELQGTGPDEFDRLDLTGAATLDGGLGISTLDGYVPTLGDTFNILSAADGVVGTFVTIEQPSAMPSGLVFDVIYGPTLVRLVVMPELIGDYNMNGVVDAADYAQWRDMLGAAVSPFSGADGDGDGIVDAGDYDVWRAHFGQSAGSSSSLSANASQSTFVPEPPTMFVCLIALVARILPRRARIQ
jgi:hypothetical protein